MASKSAQRWEEIILKTFTLDGSCFWSYLLLELFGQYIFSKLSYPTNLSTEISIAFFKVSQDTFPVFTNPSLYTKTLFLLPTAAARVPLVAAASEQCASYLPRPLSPLSPPAPERSNHKKRKWDNQCSRCPWCHVDGATCSEWSFGLSIETDTERGCTSPCTLNTSQKGVVLYSVWNMTYTAITTRCFGVAIPTSLRFAVKNTWAPGSHTAYCFNIRELFFDKE